jgi:competence protein ComEA
MSQPLLNNVIDDGDRGEADKCSASTSTMTAPAVATKPATVWKPVIIRVVLGGLALLGLAGVGAASMLAGLDGARANPPSPSAVHAGSNGPAVASAAGSAQPPQLALSDGSQSASNSSIQAATASPDTCSAGRTPDGKVILNLATMADLRTLPNIGQKRAQAILTLREKLKKFHRVQELRRVRGIGAKTLQKLAPKILVDPPAGACAAATPDGAKKT